MPFTMWGYRLQAASTSGVAFTSRLATAGARALPGSLVGGCPKRIYPPPPPRHDPSGLPRAGCVPP